MTRNGVDRSDLPRALSSQDNLMNAASDQGGKHKESRGSGKLDEKKLKQSFIGSVDAGTTSSRFIIFDGTGSPVAQHQIEFTQKYPQSGYAHKLIPITSIRRLLNQFRKDGMNRIHKSLSTPYVRVLTKPPKISSIWDTRHRTSAVLASPTNVNLPWSGIRKPVNHFTIVSHGRTHVREDWCKN
jgi:hypothetical protein